MRAILVFSVAAMLIGGCRTTRDADSDEVAEMNSAGGGLDTNRGIGADQGQGVLGATAALYSPLMSLSEKPEPGAAGSGASYLLARDSGPASVGTPRELAEIVRFISPERAEWPDCVVQDEDGTGATYTDCGLSASAGGAGFEFAVTGTTDWTDNSSDADLGFDLGIGTSGIAIEWNFDWTHGLVWTDTTLDGDFGIDYMYGVSLGGVPTATSVEFHATGTIEGITWDETCDGLIAGTFDWRSRLREGTDPWENSHVTIEIVGCDEATITQ